MLWILFKKVYNKFVSVSIRVVIIILFVLIFLYKIIVIVIVVIYKWVLFVNIWLNKYIKLLCCFVLGLMCFFNNL